MKSVFEFNQYKSYLREALGGAKKKTGLRAQAARAMGCQTAYLSQVLHGPAHLSLEQAFALNAHLGHDAIESECLLFLIQKERAGTEPLKSYFQTKIDDLVQKRLTIKNRVEARQGLNPTDQTLFYKHWYHSAIHVLLSIPGLDSRPALARHLGLPLAAIAEALEFLESCGLAVQKNGRYEIGPSHMHLSKDSPQIVQHHMNWRVRALASLSAPKPVDLHYSVVMTLAKEDLVKLKAKLLKVIDENLELAAGSNAETAVATTLDLFEL